MDFHWPSHLTADSLLLPPACPVHVRIGFFVMMPEALCICRQFRAAGILIPRRASRRKPGVGTPHASARFFPRRPDGSTLAKTSGSTLAKTIAILRDQASVEA